MSGNRVTYKLDWHGAQVFEQCVQAVVGALTEFGLRVETPAKGALVPGAGVVTGTYRRSIHSAGPTYNFASDDVTPSASSPERGGTGGGAEVQGMKVSTVLGSGLHYAEDVEARYGTLAEAHAVVSEQLPEILEKHGAQAGLK